MSSRVIGVIESMLFQVAEYHQEGMKVIVNRTFSTKWGSSTEINLEGPSFSVQ
jgi:hypothetical protein